MPSDFVAYWQARLEFVDVHYHANPDLYTRCHNALQAGQAYLALGGGVLLKSHLGCTAAVAATAQGMDLPVFGSLVLNHIGGGIDLRPIQQSLCYYNSTPHGGRLLVELPTIVTTSHRSKLQRAYANAAVERYALQPCDLGDSGRTLPASVESLVDFCRDENVVLTSGHSNRAQVEALVDLCLRKGGVRLLLNQPANPMTGMNADALKGLGAHDWLYVEQTALTLLLGYQPFEDFSEVLSEVNNVVYSSDLGQVGQLSPSEWRRQSEAWFQTMQLTAGRVRDVTLLNPLRMLSP